MKQDRNLQRHYLCHHRYICVLAAAAVVLLIACVISTYNLWIDTAAEDDATLMHLSMSCPTYPKSGQVGDMVGSWYQDFVPRGGDFVSPLYLSYYSLQCNYCE